MMQNNAFLLFKMVPCLKHAGIRVSADTKTCGSPLICHVYGILYYIRLSRNIK